MSLLADLHRRLEDSGWQAHVRVGLLSGLGTPESGHAHEDVGLPPNQELSGPTEVKSGLLRLTPTA